MFASFPGTKTYFSHLDISPDSPHLRSHGKKIVLAIAEGAKDISQLTVSLAPLQTLHAYQLRIDPTNFKVHVPTRSSGENPTKANEQNNKTTSSGQTCIIIIIRLIAATDRHLLLLYVSSVRLD